MKRLRAILTPLALAAAAGSTHAAMIGAATTGYAPAGYESEATAELRHLKSDKSDFEIGIKKSGASSYDSTANAAWVRGVNDITITYDTTTNQVAVALNGVAASTTLVNDPGAVAFHLIARNNGSHTASLTLQNLAFNGAPVALSGMADYLFASSDASSGAMSNSTFARINDPSMPSSSWSITAQVIADWTGPAPTRANSRVDISFAPVPSPGTVSLATIGCGALVPRRRRARSTFRS